jgi:hypothetical protein
MGDVSDALGRTWRRPFPAPAAAAVGGRAAEACVASAAAARTRPAPLPPAAFVRLPRAALTPPPPLPLTGVGLAVLTTHAPGPSVAGVGPGLATAGAGASAAVAAAAHDVVTVPLGLAAVAGSCARKFGPAGIRYATAQRAPSGRSPPPPKPGASPRRTRRSSSPSVLQRNLRDGSPNIRAEMLAAGRSLADSAGASHTKLLLPVLETVPPWSRAPSRT